LTLVFARANLLPQNQDSVEHSTCSTFAQDQTLRAFGRGW
jgi:hypothetical protein